MSLRSTVGEIKRETKTCDVRPSMSGARVAARRASNAISRQLQLAIPMAATGMWCSMTAKELWFTMPQSHFSLIEQGSVPVERTHRSASVETMTPAKRARDHDEIAHGQQI